MALPLVYDPRYHTWDSWASLMCEAYADQALPLPGSEENWQQWADHLKTLNVFINNGIPGPSVFTDWREWVAAVMNAVNEPTQ